MRKATIDQISGSGIPALFRSHCVVLSLRRYGVTHVLLLREYGPVVEFLDKNATMTRIGSGYRLYKLNPDATRRAP